MMHLFLNSLAASAGGGLTYTRNVIPHLAAQSGLRVTAAVSPSLRKEYGAFPNVDFVELEIPPRQRYWFEQRTLPGLVRESGANVLLSAGNFALRRSPVPQILLSRNSIYTSADFYRDIWSRREYRMWLETRLRALLAKKSIEWAEVTVAPSEAFAAELSQWTARRVIAIHHGFDRDAFIQDSRPLSPEVQSKLKVAEGCLKLLFVSHYNYYRNFETLIRSLAILRDRMAGRTFKLLLTCQLEPGKNPGAYRPEQAAGLVKRLGVGDIVVELGAIPYTHLHGLYARADVYVTPAYTETFAHPLVEAMASGVPIVASDIAVHREICGDAAVYFEKFSPEALAACVVQVSTSSQRRARMLSAGLERSQDFSWKLHADKIVNLARTLIDGKGAISANSND